MEPVDSDSPPRLGGRTRDDVAPRSEAPSSAPLKARALRWSRAAMTGVLVLAAVIGALAILAGPRPHPPLPGYMLTIAGNPLPPSADYPTIERLSFKPGGEVTITARPSEAVRGKFEVTAAIVVPNRAGGRYYSRTAEVAKDGTVTLAGTTDWVFDGVAPGAYQLQIFIRRPGRLADEPGGSVELTQDVAWRIAEAF